MTAQNISTLLQELPILIMYVVPGYLLLWTMGFILSGKIEKDKNLLLKSTVLSYLWITLWNVALKGKALDTTGWKIVIIVTAIIAGYIASRIIVSQRYKDFLKRVRVTRTVHNNCFRDIIDFENGLQVAAFLEKDKRIYQGEIRYFEEKDGTENTYIVLSNWVKYDYDGTEVENYESSNNRRVLLNTRDISRMELCYDPNSSRIK